MEVTAYHASLFLTFSNLNHLYFTTLFKSHLILIDKRINKALDSWNQQGYEIDISKELEIVIE